MNISREIFGHFFWAGLVSNICTLLCAFCWVRFFDMRSGYLGTPNAHHRTYMQALVVLSIVACTMGVLAASASFAGFLKLSP